MPIGVDADARRAAEREAIRLGRITARPAPPPNPQPGPAPPPPLPPPDTRFDEADEIRIVVWTIWRTSGDERVCPVCSPLDGAAWPLEEGPQPPLHVNCRCQRVVGWVEHRFR